MTEDSFDMSVPDAGGTMVRAYDDVVLLRRVATPEKGNISVELVEPETRATIIMLDAKTGEISLECYIEPRGFVFASVNSRDVRLLRRREDKLKDAKGSVG